MARTVAGLLVMVALAGSVPAAARGPRGGLFGHVPRGHPINAWVGSRHLRLR